MTRFERGKALRERTVDALGRALVAAGVDSIAENGGGAGVGLRQRREPDTIAKEDLNASNNE